MSVTGVGHLQEYKNTAFVWAAHLRECLLGEVPLYFKGCLSASVTTMYSKRLERQYFIELREQGKVLETSY